MLFSTAGTRLYIGGVIQMKDADLTVSDFANQSDKWTEIMRHENLGSLGDESAELEVKPIRSDRVQRLKGLRSASSMELVCGLDSEDAGQVALVAAERTRSNYAFRLVFPPMPDGGTPAERLFIAVVGSLNEQYDEADFVMKMNATLWRNSNVVQVEAIPAP